MCGGVRVWRRLWRGGVAVARGDFCRFGRDRDQKKVAVKCLDLGFDLGFDLANFETMLDGSHLFKRFQTFFRGTEYSFLFNILKRPTPAHF